jgi:tartrate dehydrogenase/decarboxylase/D-malate dehydrogenase
MTASTLTIAHIPGDGIGGEVTEAAIPIIDAAARETGVKIAWTRFDWSSEHYLRTGRMMDPDGVEMLRAFDAIFFGAMGSAEVPDHVSARGLRLAICQGLDQYVSHRPAWSLDGVPAPLGDRRFNLVVVRENTEGEYTGAGGRVHAGHAAEVALETSVFTRSGVRRVAEYAFELAAARTGSLTLVTKSNVLWNSMSLWDEVVLEVADELASVEVERTYVDALVAELILRPERFDVILASNAHGDIVSDLTGAMMGSLGMAGSGNIDPTGRSPSMFEPAHGSAPNIAGEGIANPAAAIRSGALLLAHVGLPEAGQRVNEALDRVLQSGVRTPDLGGEARGTEVAEAVLAQLRS